MSDFGTELKSDAKEQFLSFMGLFFILNCRDR